MNLKKQLAFSFFAEGEESARQIIEDVQDRVSIVELRLDQLSSSCDLQLLVNAFPQITFIFSNRSSPIKSLSVEPHKRVFVDCPLDRDGLPPDLLDYQIIHSWHATKEGDEDLYEISNRLKSVRRAQDLTKLVYFCDFVEDYFYSDEVDICFSQGNASHFTRVLSLVRGGAFMYVSAKDRHTALGQFDLDTAVKFFPNGLGESTLIGGVVGGEAVVDSGSPIIWHGAFSDSRPSLSFAYLPLPVRDIQKFADILDLLPLSFLSVTQPWKSWAESFANIKSGYPSANFLLKVEEGFQALSTDGAGAFDLLKDKGLEKKDKILILGNGGAAQAIAHAGGIGGYDVVIAARNPKPPQIHLEQVNLDSYQCVIQATSLGSNSNPGMLLPHQSFRKGCLTLDLVYNPIRTKWLESASADGATVIDGLQMLISQFKYQLSALIDRPALVLIGMRGSGKTTLGKALSEDLGMLWLDIDKELERLHGRSITELLADDNFDFRKKELEILQKESCKKNIIISTGGGVVEYEKSREALKRHPFVVYLRCSHSILLQRQSINPRPSLTDLALEAEIESLLASRREWYENCASYIVENDESIEQSLHSLSSFFIH